MDAKAASTTETLRGLTEQNEALAKRLSELVHQRDSLTRKLDGLLRERVKATVEGKTTKTGTDFAKVKDELEVLDEAISELSRQSDALSTRLRTARDNAKIEKSEEMLRSLTGEYARSMQAAQQSGTEMVAALNSARDLVASMKAVAVELPQGAGDVVGSQFDDPRVRDMMGARISRLLAKVAPQGSLGGLRWAPEHPRDEDWGDEEWDEMERTISGLFETARRTLN